MHAKKSYGQHFLKDDDIAARVAGGLRLAEQAGRVLEVGPGMGMLSKHLLASTGFQTWAVEADKDMVEYLQKHYPDFAKRVIYQDFLEFKPEETFGNDPFCLIGNFPYNISSQIVFKLLDYRAQIPEMVGMFQKEVADRIVAPPGSRTYGITSVISQAFYTPEYLFTVPPEAFNPPPKVMSAVIRLARKEVYELDCDEKLFRHVVKTAFNQRRKMLRNTLKPFLPNEELMEDPFFQKRPEELSWEQYRDLTLRIKPSDMP